MGINWKRPKAIDSSITPTQNPFNQQFPSVSNSTMSSMFTEYDFLRHTDSLIGLDILYALFSRAENIDDEQLKKRVENLLKDIKISFISGFSTGCKKHVLFQRGNKNIVCIAEDTSSTFHCKVAPNPNVVPQKYSHKFFNDVGGLIDWINDALFEVSTPQDDLVKKIKKLCTP